MRIWRVHGGDLMAAVSGALLLLSMRLVWYREHTFAGTADEPQFTLDAWQTFDVGDYILDGVAGIAMAMLIVAVLSPRAAGPFSAFTTVAGVVGVGAVLVRLVAQPGANEMVDIATGAWAGLACALGVFMGGWLAMRAERRPAAHSAEGTVSGAATG